MQHEGELLEATHCVLRCCLLANIVMLCCKLVTGGLPVEGLVGLKAQVMNDQQGIEPKRRRQRKIRDPGLGIDENLRQPISLVGSKGLFGLGPLDNSDGS